MRLTSNSVIFNFDIPNIHEKLIVRVRVFTECTDKNKTFEMTLDGPTPTVVTTSVPSSA